MIGPGTAHHHTGGLTLVQTGHHDGGLYSSGTALQQSILAQQVAETVQDDDPCHIELNKIFESNAVQATPAEVLTQFVTDYCVDAADDFLPSKYR